MSQRLLRPRPAVWSRTGRLLWGLILLAMFALWRWTDSTVATLALVPLMAAAFLVMAADERKRARQHYEDSDE